jgi:hypothetical protein
MNVTESGASRHPALASGEKNRAYPSKSAKGIGVCGDARGFPAVRATRAGASASATHRIFCPAFNEMLARVEGGENRRSCGGEARSLRPFARGHARGAQTVDAAGATFVSVADSFDTTKPTGRLVLNIMLSLAEFELTLAQDRRCTNRIAYSSSAGQLSIGRKASGSLRIS